MLSIRGKGRRLPQSGLLLLVTGILPFAPAAAQSTLVDFGGIALGSESYFQVDPPPDGSGGSTALNLGGVKLPHTTPSFGGFSEFTVSNQTDVTTPGFGNPASAFTGGGFGDANYGVAFVGGDTLSLTLSQPGGVTPESMRVTNTTYAALSMRDGDDFAKKFGGPDGDDPDYFRLSITGVDTAEQDTGTVEFYLADYRFTDNAQDEIVDSWEEVDLSSLGSGVTELRFALDSSDVGDFGMNTPAYFAMDDLSFTAVPEPSVFALLAGLAVFGIGLRKRGLRRCG